MLDVLLEAWWYRQAIDEIHSDVSQHGELAEMLERVHTAEARDRVSETDGRRQETGSTRQQVVQAPAGPRRRHRVVDEFHDRRRRSIATATATATRRQRLRTETESTCKNSHARRIASRTFHIPANARQAAKFTFEHHIIQSTGGARKRIWATNQSFYVWQRVAEL